MTKLALIIKLVRYAFKLYSALKGVESGDCKKSNEVSPPIYDPKKHQELLEFAKHFEKK